MKLTYVRIKNFRGISDVEMSFNNRTSVIVGPNAIGKTTVLEAIRLTKSMLMPSYSTESQEVLASLGAHSMNSGYYDITSLCNDVSKKIEICVKFQIQKKEIDFLKERVGSMAKQSVQDELGNNFSENGTNLIQYFSQEKGRKHLEEKISEISTHLDGISELEPITTSLIIDPEKNLIHGTDYIVQMLVKELSNQRPYTSGLFSYFPADRSMPLGEVNNIQIGHSDTQQQIQSHMGKPELKFKRLKQFIVNHVLMNEEDTLRQDFDEIFEEILTGKKLFGFKLSSRNSMQVLIKEYVNDSIFDIDNMSSGEKGLILLFLFMKRRILQGGVVLIDEPEVHLNPAVCKKLLPFMISNIFEPLSIQAIICTHSPEILVHAYDRDDCTLFHLRSGTDLSPIYRKDKDEVFQALKKLGAKPDDILFSKGNIFVEGSHDIDLLEKGFEEVLNNYNLSYLGGREEVEKEIKTLQRAEKIGELDSKNIFIFDNDRKPSSLTSSEKVIVNQWDRYCLENYLIDNDPVYDAIHSLGKADENNISRGNIGKKIEEIAMMQILYLSAENMYRELEPENCGFRRKEIRRCKNYEEIAKSLFTRIKHVQEMVTNLEEQNWSEDFIQRCKSHEAELRNLWDNDWKRLCDGKQLIADIRNTFNLGISELHFKKLIMHNMKASKSESWRLISSFLSI